MTDFGPVIGKLPRAASKLMAPTTERVCRCSSTASAASSSARRTAASSGDINHTREERCGCSGVPPSGTSVQGPPRVWNSTDIPLCGFSWRSRPVRAVCG